MREQRAAEHFERQVAAILSRSAQPEEELGRDLQERVGVARELAHLDLVRESRVRESLRARLALAGAGGTQVSPALPRRRIARRLVLATGLALALALSLLALVAPRSLAAILDPVVRVLEVFRVGEHTEIIRNEPQTTAETKAILERHSQLVASGQAWFLHTPYMGFGGRVPRGRKPELQEATSVEDLRSLTPLTLRLPVGQHRGRQVLFHHAQITPDGQVLIYFGSGDDELLLYQTMADEQHSFAFSRGIGRTSSDGSFVMESPELKTERLSLDGHTVAWDPVPEGWPDPEQGGLLLWEADGASHALMGRSLTREEAVALFLSLRPLEQGK